MSASRLKTAVRSAVTITVSVGLLLAPTQALAAPAGNTSAPMPPVAPAIKRAPAPEQTPPPPPSPTAALTVHPMQKVAPPADAPTTIDRNALQKSAQVGELEKLMFGAPSTTAPLDQRLNRLESEVFHSTNPDWDATRRIERLTQTLIGNGSSSAPYPPSAMPPSNTTYPAPQGSMPYNQQVDPYAQGDPYAAADPGYIPPQQYGDAGQPAQQQAQPQHRNVAMPPAPNLDSPEYTRELPRIQVEKAALEFVNQIRDFNGLPTLSWDETAYKVAQQHVLDLCTRNTISHNNSKGENPDVRYTKAGGTDSMLEGLISMKTSGRMTLSKGLAYRVIKELTSSQDDRDALMSPYATSYAFSFNNNVRNDKLISCSETVTDIADLEPIPTEVKVGDKLDIKGTVKGPYRFQKISLAWEGLNGQAEAEAAVEEEQDEALPYFPPLDYTAYARKTEHDWEKTQRLLQLAGLGAVLAGSLFMPPVALAAPLIASAGPSKPKPVSDIPIKGGVKVNGNAFEYKAPISKDNKEGIYYITVWIDTANDPTPIAVSRRAVIARAAEGEQNPSPVVADHPKETHETK